MNPVAAPSFQTASARPRFSSVLINPAHQAFYIFGSGYDRHGFSLKNPHPERLLQITGPDSQQWVFREFEPIARLTQWANEGHASLRVHLPEILQTVRQIVAGLPVNTNLIDTGPETFPRVVQLVPYSTEAHDQTRAFVAHDFQLAEPTMVPPRQLGDSASESDQYILHTR